MNASALSPSVCMSSKRTNNEPSAELLGGASPSGYLDHEWCIPPRVEKLSSKGTEWQRAALARAS